MKKRLVAALLALAMTAGLVTGCGGQSAAESSSGSSGSESSSDVSETEGAAENLLSEEVELTMYLYGSEEVANQSILDMLNEKLKAELNTTLTVKYLDYSDLNTKYPLLWSSGESFDMAYVSPGASVPYGTLARQDALVDITDMLDEYAPALKAALPEKAWDSTKVNGKIYAVPSDYSEYTAYGFITRSDLMEQYGIESINSIEDMEKYMDAALADGRIPLNGSSALAMDMYRMLIDTTSDWINAPGIQEGEPFLVSTTSNPEEIFHPAFTDEFEEFAVRMREWADKEYWSKDILSASQDDKNNFLNDLSAAFIAHQPDWTGQYGVMQEKFPGVDMEFYCFPEENGKIVTKAGVENATGISVTSKYPERALMVIEKLMTDEECYRLFQYGIEGVQYEIADGKVQKPASYDSATDSSAFRGWAFRRDEFNLPLSTEDERRYTLNEAWKEVAIDNPYMGFTFENSAVSSEISSVANVNAQLGIQILLGKTLQDPREAVAEYRSQLETAGIDKIIEEVQRQYSEFTQSK